MPRFLRSAPRALALLACAGLLATPALAAPAARTAPVTVPLSAKPVQPGWSPADESAANHRRWRHRRGDGIDGGDLLGGLLILGGIAAVAGAIDKSQDEARERRYPDRGYDYRSDAGERWDDRAADWDRDAEDWAASDEQDASDEAAWNGSARADNREWDADWDSSGDYDRGYEFEGRRIR